MVAERVPLRPIFRIANSQPGARSGDYGGWEMTGIAAQQEMYGLVPYRDAETIVPATCRSRFLRITSLKLCKTCTQK
jgi:hypothetical protein